MKKTLVYHLYLIDDLLNNTAMKVHLECLKKYEKIFDDMIFVLAADDVSNTQLINDGIQWAMSIRGGNNCTIRIRKNTDLYETDTFREEILEKRTILDGFVFFAHSKGCTNMVNESYNQYSVLKWICGMYFYSLNFMSEVADRFCGHARASEIFYGPFLMQYRDVTESPMLRMNKNNCFYAGTFFWINMPKFNNYLNMGIITLPNIDDRYWTETMVGNICGREEYGDGLASHNDIAIWNDFNLYKMQNTGWLELGGILGDGNDFLIMSETIINKSK